MKRKHYPINNTVISNKRKIPGAFVWYRGMLKTITSQNVGSEHLIIANLFEVKRSSVKLAKIGDSVSYEEIPLKGLPDRCKEIASTTITQFIGNGLVRLAYDNDTTHFEHLKKA